MTQARGDAIPLFRYLFVATLISALDPYFHAVGAFHNAFSGLLGFQHSAATIAYRTPRPYYAIRL